MVFIRRLRWTTVNIAHIARHDIRPQEVTEVCVGDPVAREARQGRVIVLGPTTNGRILVVVLESEACGVYFPVTAWPASRKERQVYADEKGAIAA